MGNFETNTREILQDVGIGNDFLNSTPIAQEIRVIIELYQIKKPFHSKVNKYQSEETAYRMGEKSLPAVHTTGVKYSESMKNSKIQTPKTNNPINKWANELNR
jgi:hypothetical protein